MRAEVEVTATVEVDVSIGDMMAAFIDELRDPTTERELLRGLNCAISYVIKAPTEFIEKLSPNVRAILVQHLQAQAERYEALAPAVPLPVTKP